jgi:hypothetical protein
MGSIITMKVAAASISLRPLLEAAPWEGRITAVFHRSLLCTTPHGRLLHFHTGPQLASPFSLRMQEDFANVLLQAPMVRGMRVRNIGCAIEIAEHVHLRLDGITFYQSPRHMMEVLDRAALSLFMPSHPQVMQSAVSSLLTQGETSGTDTTLGLLTCLEALLFTQDRVSS